MARARVHVSQADLVRHMRTSPELSAHLIEQGRLAQEHWRSLPPTTDTGRDLKGKSRTGEYGASVQIKVMRTPSRMKVRVYTKSPIAHLVEYGSVHMPEYAPMAATRSHMIGRGARAATQYDRGGLDEANDD